MSGARRFQLNRDGISKFVILTKPMTGERMKMLLVLAAFLMTAVAQANTVSVKCETQNSDAKTVVNFSYNIILSFSGPTGFASSPMLTSLTTQGHSTPYDMSSKKFGEPTFKVTSEGNKDIVHIEMFPYENYFPYETRNVDLEMTGCGGKGAGKGILTERPYRSAQTTTELSCTCTGDWL
jgi:hypothetical protein